MNLLTAGSLEDLIPGPGEATDLAESELPGLALKTLTISKTHDLWGKAEVYLFGVAVDASEEVKIVPFGMAELEEGTTALAIQKMGTDQPYSYMGQGMPLVLPPVKGFLALRLMVVDADNTVRTLAPLIKSAGELAGSKEAIALLVLTGMPHAAAVAVVLGKAVETFAAAMEKNRDDLIGVFQGYFSLTDTAEPVQSENGDAKVELQWVT